MRSEDETVKVLAIICAYNEADIIGWTVRHLRVQGCDVLVIDCASTDDTAWVAAAAGARIEAYGPPPVSWHALLRRVEQIAAASDADWIIHCDADEIRYATFGLRGPAAQTLAEGFGTVQIFGCNAVDHQVVTFHPTDNGYDGSQDPEEYFRYCSHDSLNQRIGQVKAWRNVGAVDLATSGGHQVQFPGRHVYPVKWLSKHYPIRSQQHGERKVFRERAWKDPAEGRTEWHVQYKGIEPGYRFLKDPKSVMEWK